MLHSGKTSRQNRGKVTNKELTSQVNHLITVCLIYYFLKGQWGGGDSFMIKT